MARATARSTTGEKTATRTGRVATSLRPGRNGSPPVLVEVRRGEIVESRHRGHVVQVGPGGVIEAVCGDPETVVTLRSCVKPFALVALLEAGGSEEFGLSDAELAVMAGSHAGEDMHVRTIQAVFRRANLSQALLACGTDGAPLDALTAARLAREGEKPGPIRHNCSGMHAASILLSKLRGWSVEDYWRPEHPSQSAIRSVVARVFRARADRLRTAVDDCGVLTYAFPLVEVARAYALLADPAASVRGGRGQAEVEAAALATRLLRVRDAMLAAPEMVGGTRERLDTSLMKAAAGRLVVKGGAEALRAVGLLQGATHGGRAGARGMAIKIEDGNGRGRALWVATVEALAQVGALDGAALRQLARYHHPAVLDPRGEPIGAVMPQFQLAPISELS